MPHPPSVAAAPRFQAFRGGRWHVLHGIASVAVFLLPALVLSTPTNLLPFGLLLLLSSLGGADYLWRARPAAHPYAGLLAMLAAAVIALGMWSVWHFNQVVEDVDNRSRFLVMPWAMLWACALRPSQGALWWGALTGLVATLVVAVVQVAGGLERAEGWTNAIVLADTVLVLMVVLVLCLVCSIVVAGSAVGLKPLQQEQRALDKQRNILAVAGLMQDGMSADEVAKIFAERISSRLVDLKTGELLDYPYQRAYPRNHCR